MTCLYVHENRILSDPGGARDARLPHPVQVLSFFCSFREKKLPNNRLAHPQLGTPGSTTDILLILNPS